jgi:predicted alpha/beta hydrolase family esterase
MLPAAIPKARIMQYGYMSEWFGDETTRLKASNVAQQLLHEIRFARQVCAVVRSSAKAEADVFQEFPKRPMIFIAHCFGGLVVLKVLSTLRAFLLSNMLTIAGSSTGV